MKLQTSAANDSMQPKQSRFTRPRPYMYSGSASSAQEGTDLAMVINLKTALAQLPLPATPEWPEGVWDKTLLEHGTMSVLVFTPRGQDYQTAHSQDELYIVVKGSGTLMIEDAPHAFSEGDVLFVPANKQHRFVDFSNDLVTWAIFWGPEGGESA
jgi:mannose-6-phosphate isomerase-like protein (cupin superfamily)